MIRRFFFNDTATTEIYTLSLHDALPIFLREQFGFVVGKVLCRALADGQHLHVAAFLCGQLEHIGVVTAGKAAVTGNDHQQRALDLAAAQVGVAGPEIGRASCRERV